MDQSKALSTAKEAFELWQEGRLDEAERRYRDALAVADPHDYWTATLHGEYATVLTLLMRFTEAGRHYERALHLELQGGPESSAAVVMARYFLGKHYLLVGDPESARRVVAPSLALPQTPLSWLVEAEALHQSGAVEDAQAAAKRAVAEAVGDEQREGIRARLAALFDEAD